MCYFGYLSVELVPAKVPDPRAAQAAVAAIVAEHHEGGLRAATTDPKTWTPTATHGVVGALACNGCACDDRARLLGELAPIAATLLDTYEVRSVALAYLWAAGGPCADVDVTLGALPVEPSAVSDGSFRIRITRSADGPGATRSLIANPARKRS